MTCPTRAAGHAPRVSWLVTALLAMVCGGCGLKNNTDPGAANGTTAAQHLSFPIDAASTHALGRTVAGGAIACASCHAPTAPSFKDFTCTGCHDHVQPVTDRLHVSVMGYTYTSAGCLKCHPASDKNTFDHKGISDGCALCHDTGATFAALPVAGFTHPPTGGADCSGCHVTTNWKGAKGAPVDATHDPANDLVVTALIPTYAGTSMTALSPRSETFSMSMNHSSVDVAGAAFSACANCHPNAGANAFFPGNLHSSLTNLMLAQPTTCASCHADAVPVGFVGPAATSPARAPASGEMKHDAVAWANGAPTTTKLVPAECGLCHGNPALGTRASWATSLAGASPAQYHASLDTAKMAQPASCLDCHANSRPTGMLTSMNSTVPAGMQFDHGAAAAQGDCASCHATAGAARFSSWSKGKFHLPQSASPATCLPCHAGEAPTSTAGWVSTTYKNSPFDYVKNAAGIAHGDGQDCATCHAGPGTGAWGSTQNWIGGTFKHGTTTIAATTCIACHSTQRPDLQPGATAASATAQIGFDHSQNGSGECLGCHQATVTAGAYVNYANPSTHALPGGDWKGGQTYPGSSFAGSSDQFIMVTETSLIRSGAANLVTGTSSITATLFNGMLHVSTALPPQLAAGPSAMPNNATCWHCHTNTNGVVTAYRNGNFHSALTSFSATPGGAKTPLPQPTSHCSDCHQPMLPVGIVQKGGSSLLAMDHSAEFSTAVTIAGASVTKVSQLDCSTCHGSPGATWADGVFHASIGSATPKDCVGCHYMLMADTAKSDVKSAASFAMKHASAQLPFQTCTTCHAGALAKATSAPAATTAWQSGALHASLQPQPSSCSECHTVSLPASSTQSSITYALAAGGTATNGAQWMSHASGTVAGQDCAACHAMDAKSAGSAWSKATAFHATVAKPGTCQECHGLANGGGAVAGTNNNLPAGPTSSTTATTASATSGVPAGTLDQVSHADVNVTGHDCNFCHTQAGPSKTAGVQGKEWAQARFHANFLSAANPLVLNTTTGRCSNCHLNIKPGPGATAQDHSAFTSAPGSEDCSSCHSYPGTGTAAAPNWLGAAGVPQVISVGGFTIPQPPATSATLQTGINGLPHPTVGSGVACTTCHAQAGGGRQAAGYDHLSALINSNCGSCHEAGSNLVGTLWNGATTAAAGAGDTRPFSIVGLVPSTNGNGRALTNDYSHFFPADCHECHAVPSGNGAVTTGSAYKTAWKFNHKESNMTRPSTCNMCHGSPNNLPN
jgi:hypothetical protein